MEREDEGAPDPDADPNLAAIERLMDEVATRLAQETARATRMLRRQAVTLAGLEPVTRPPDA